jgi:hypothetical protein
MKILKKIYYIFVAVLSFAVSIWLVYNMFTINTPEAAIDFLHGTKIWLTMLVTIYVVWTIKNLKERLGYGPHTRDTQDKAVKN